MTLRPHPACMHCSESFTSSRYWGSIRPWVHPTSSYTTVVYLHGSTCLGCAPKLRNPSRVATSDKWRERGEGLADGSLYRGIYVCVECYWCTLKSQVG